MNRPLASSSCSIRTSSIEQNQATIGRITALPGSIVKAERDDWSGRVVFGSVQTLARANRRARMTPVSHLVIDECHRAAADSYQAIIGHARSLRNGIKLLGLSATPERGDGRSLRRTFSNVGYPGADCRPNRARHPGAAAYLHHRPRGRRRARRDRRDRGRLSI